MNTSNSELFELDAVMAGRSHWHGGLLQWPALGETTGRNVTWRANVASAGDSGSGSAHAQCSCITPQLCDDDAKSIVAICSLGLRLSVVGGPGVAGAASIRVAHRRRRDVLTSVTEAAGACSCSTPQYCDGPQGKVAALCQRGAGAEPTRRSAVDPEQECSCAQPQYCDGAVGKVLQLCSRGL